SLQIIFSGKAHPYDYAGKEIISTLVKYSKTHPGRVVFLENYNIDIAKLMVQGVDVWLNNPKRPLEASATSGMKAAMNGVINFSILDGWWPEACRHQINGWQIGGGYQGPEQNYYDLVSLYDVLIEEVLPTYYERKHQWVRMMEESIKMSEAFTAERMLYEYYNLLYYPSLTAINVKAKNLSVLQEV
ncbi:MAG TPA: alpha-glucan family phosphorylase, partial [Bacillota bacterium]|nr:alpha-glucan family phosphorylase [Bacillota bacterium]